MLQWLTKLEGLIRKKWSMVSTTTLVQMILAIQMCLLQRGGPSQRLFCKWSGSKGLLQRGQCITTTLYQMIWIKQPIAKRTVHYNNFFADDPDQSACCKEDGALRQLFSRQSWSNCLLQRGRSIFNNAFVDDPDQSACCNDSGPVGHHFANDMNHLNSCILSGILLHMNIS